MANILIDQLKDVLPEGLHIPKTALEIVKHPACMDDEYSEDEYFSWMLEYME